MQLTAEEYIIKFKEEFHISTLIDKKDGRTIVKLSHPANPKFVGMMEVLPDNTLENVMETLWNDYLLSQGLEP